MNILNAPNRAITLDLLWQGLAHAEVAQQADVALNTVTKLAYELGGLCCQTQAELFAGLACTHVHVKSPRVSRREMEPLWYGLVAVVAVVPGSLLVPAWTVREGNRRAAEAFAPLLFDRMSARPDVTFDHDDLLADHVRAAIDRCDPALTRSTTTVRRRASPASAPATSRRLDRLGRWMSLHFMKHNFVNPGPRGATPAMEAGVADHPWTTGDVINLLG